MTAVIACPLCGGEGAKRIFEREFQQRHWWLALCDSCGLHFTDPPPTAEDIRGFYAGQYHSNLRSSGGAEEAFGPKYRRYCDWIGGFVKSGATLDVGCSTGLLVKMLKDRGYRAEGMELNPDSARWGRENYGIPIQEGVLESLEARDGVFDLITLTDVLEHTASPPAELRTINRLLGPSGHLMVTFPDISAPGSRYLHTLSKLTRRGYVWRSCHIPLHTWEFTYPTAKRLFERGGFEIAGFRRSEVSEFAFDKAGVLSMPANLTALPLIRNYYGSQMEFMLAKRPRK
jgi:SAM-dependent methyltransferase